ncbi:hypothetical protein [Rhodanobacter sp. L36]|jgi:hypothetical protein|uniref:hypothetical protein n=1 Tax=Rhodanobacter sp. L36 TaxID=1747221 RepID=UPI00131CFE53|nr:hypothetical protein [Rhodanobacter sp. L36]
MQTLKLSFSLPDDTHPDMELRLSANDAACDVVIALPMHAHPAARVSGEALSTDNANDDYVLGGYAGI